MILIVNYEEKTENSDAALIVATPLSEEKLIEVKYVTGNEAENLYSELVSKGEHNNEH